MDRVLLGVSSVTHAMRGQRILASFGISAQLGRSTRRSTDKSCGYTLSVPSDRAAQAQEILLRNNIRIKGRRDDSTS